ncbi:MAPEG family protein [Phenylobacterium sp.]|uniref:MAPEG family protein n=1 Tax=Phenylobacterium sp. TaxID=1871053 RepID=UPI0011FB7A34|nr:MAPEG family protein [Phenylobacterium sp.]THD58877.1 MAG: glutathione S-transferase [Phenylobacterium sp.]
MEITPSAHAAALWVGLHLILLLVLSVMVVRQRRKHQVVLGDADIPELARAVRAFGNAAEYIPGGLIAIAVLATLGAPPMVVHAVGLVLFVGRVAHAVGLSRSGGSSLLRSAGVIATWVAYILGAVALLFYAIP